MQKIDVGIIEIKWDGPYTSSELNKMESFGLYQIYGTHPIYGSNVLLYIGKTTNSHSARLNTHQESWIKYEYDKAQFYIGRIVSDETQNLKKEDKITIAEQLLIYYCAPAYNTTGKARISKEEEVIVLNFGKIARLPTEVSTLWYNSLVWKNDDF